MGGGMLPSVVQLVTKGEGDHKLQ